MSSKGRLSASVDAALLRAASASSEHQAKNLSQWVTEALRLKLDHDRRLEALSDFVHAFEAEHGEITTSEIEQATRAVRARAVAVRGRAALGRRKRRG